MTRKKNEKEVVLSEAEEKKIAGRLKELAEVPSAFKASKRFPNNESGKMKIKNFTIQFPYALIDPIHSIRSNSHEQV